jgi:methyl-accepting chemotaxis protein
MMTIERYSRVGAMTLGGFVAAILLAAGIGMNQIRNGGALDNEEEMLSDFRADILPPPMFLVEAFSNASIMAIHRDAYAINEERLTKLEEEYWAAERRWAQRPLSDKLKTDLDKYAQETGKAFWDEINTSLKPAAKRWDEPAIKASHRRLLLIFRAHRSANGDLVAQSESLTAAAKDQNAIIQMLVSAGAFVAVLLVVVKPF